MNFKVHHLMFCVDFITYNIVMSLNQCQFRMNTKFLRKCIFCLHSWCGNESNSMFYSCAYVFDFVFYRRVDWIVFAFLLKLLQVSGGNRLEKVLKDAAMEDRTVILTTLNEAWAAPNSVIDLFLESFRLGDGTRRLLNHLVIIALDQKAFARCLVVHTHCFSLVSEGVDFHREAYFMTPDYLKMMWRRIDFLRSVLEMGYNFVFTVISSLCPMHTNKCTSTHAQN